MRSPVRLVLLRSVLAGSLVAAVPAQAERWKELPNYGRYNYRLDLDSVQWTGRIVRYRAEIVNRSQVPARRGEVTALIDCDTGKRKLLASEQYLPDGSTRSDPLPDLGWQPVRYLSELPEHFLCRNELSGAPVQGR